MPTNDISQDEIRRQLAESQDEHEATLPHWRRTLDRVFDPDSGATPAEKHAALGLPDRRSFFRVGGLTIATTAVIASCSKKKKNNITETGATPSTAASSTTTTPGSQEMDVTLLRTAQSIEALAVQTYQELLDGGKMTTSSLIDTAKLFQSQHQQHAGLVAATTTTAGGTSYDQPNAYLKETVIDPLMAKVTDETTAVQVALLIENTLAQSYTASAGVLTTPELRQTLMSIGGVEARHMSVLYGAIKAPQVPLPFIATRLAPSEKAFITPEGTPKPTTPPPTSATTSTSLGAGSSTTTTAAK